MARTGGGCRGFGNSMENNKTAVARLLAGVCAAIWAAGAPLRGYLRARSRMRAAVQFDAVDLHTLEDIGLLRTHLTAAWVSEDNDNRRNPPSVVRGPAQCSPGH